jgi:hypothetical protein
MRTLTRDWRFRGATLAAAAVVIGGAIAHAWVGWYERAGATALDTLAIKATAAVVGLLGGDAASYLKPCPAMLITVGLFMLELGPLVALLAVAAVPKREHRFETARTLVLGWLCVALAFALLAGSAIATMALLAPQHLSSGSYAYWTMAWIWRCAMSALPFVGFACLLRRRVPRLWLRALIWCAGLLAVALATPLVHALAPAVLMPAAIDRALFSYVSADVMRAVLWSLAFSAGLTALTGRLRQPMFVSKSRGMLSNA